MSTGAAIAVGVGALVLVLYLTRRQEQQTAAMIANIKSATPTAGSSGGALSFKQLFQGGAIVVGTYLGGPEQGFKVAQAVT